MTLFRRGLALLTVLVCFGASASGQGASVDEGAPESPQEVSIGVGFSGVFGVGDTVRPGDWAGLMLVINDSHDQPRNLAVRVSMPDPDGDTIERQRVIASTPGRDQSVWMYVRLPFSFSRGSLLTVSVHEVVGDVMGARTEVGKTLSWTRIQARNVIDAEDTMIGVVGRGQYGLDEYQMVSGRGGSGQAPNPRTSHDTFHIVSGIMPASMPDQWLGLLPFESLVWSDPPPRELGESPDDPRPSALRAWVQGGGHLVILLPSVGESWFAASNPVAELLPDVRTRRVEGVDYEAYRQLLMDREPADGVLPVDQVITVFEPRDGAAPEDAMAIINGPDGTVVTRKLVGTGMVTLVGLDLGDRRMMSNLFAADAFWHRILGKRFDILTPDEKKEIKNPNVTASSRVYTDGYIEPGIRMSGRAAAGVLLGLVVFALYWVLAGPGGFGLLKLKGLTRHAWVAFVAMVALFAGITWIGSRASRPTSRQALHVTYLDHVYGQDVQRARVWATVMLPTYEDQRIALTPAGEDADGPMALTPFAGPSRTDSMGNFPDARAYVMDVRHPEEVVVPARSTSKAFQFDWVGVSRARGWGMPVPDPSDPPRLEAGGRLVGTLTHDLPGPMRNVSFVIVEKQVSPRELWRLRGLRGTGDRSAMPFVARALTLPTDRQWEAGDRLDLSQQVGRERENGSVQQSIVGGSEAPTRVDSQASRFHYSTSLYSMLDQPQYRDVQFGREVRYFQRRLTHGLDLSKWFTQPCLIVIGEVEDRASPVALYAGSASSRRELPSSGRTVVRWVYPLTPNPPVFSEITQ